MRRLRLIPYVWRRFSGLPRLRAAYWLLIKGWETEICTECGRPVRIVWWCHDDRLWEQVTGNKRTPGSKEAAGGVWCIYCFTEAARAYTGWLEWAPLNLKYLHETKKSPK